MEREFPQLNSGTSSFYATAVVPGGCSVRLDATEKHLRPGNTVSGPSLFTLADIGGYVCVLSHAGPDALSVTTNLNINFVRKAPAGPVDGHCRIIKLGRSLMVFEIDMRAGAEGVTVAHATGTYSIPPKPK
ncbi:PaaI family thioesterase [Nitratireductor mangrovi]|uniref:PaaI family thioesterase n=1 Tax=Nitratireductor mangrovi TaxID=2599600 RepID=A0A5B8L5U5_9HYPH|nr:PaaI family thioesterase [Nitratireductor mangrovi]QDZ03294.1 PaaI family thioesterase [Nitratireductor mangrovi]